MNPIQERTMSGFPISIGTGLALETIITPIQGVYDPTRVVPDKVIKLSSYRVLYVNIATLIRNMITSVERSKVPSLSPLLMVDTVLEEMELIRTLVSESTTNTNVIFYYSDYSKIKRDKKFDIRPIHTKLQILLDRLTRGVASSIISKTNVSITNDLIIIADRSAPVLMLTHIPYDLLALKSINNGHLLESSTGRIKKSSQWNTKYVTSKVLDIHILPFTRELLIVFGDRALIKPKSIVIRRGVMEIATSNRWNPLTSEVTVRKNIMNYKDASLYTVLYK